MEETRNFLSRNQKRIVAAALGLLGITFIFIFLFGVFLLLREFIATFSNVLWPLAVAGVLALILKPVVELFEDKLKLNRIGSIVLIYGIALLALGAFLSIFVPILFTQVITFVEFLPEFINKSNELIVQKYPDVATNLENLFGENWLSNVKQALDQSINGLLNSAFPAINRLKDYVVKVSAFGTALAIVPVYLFFLLESNRNFASDLKRQISFLNKDIQDDIIFLSREFVESIVSFFRGQIIIGVIMGVLLSLGFTIVGLEFGIVLGITIGLLNIIPYLGTILGLSFVLPIAYFQPEGGVPLLGLSLLVFVVVQLIEGYLLTPKIMGKQTGLHPMAIIIAIFFWGTALNGLLGMILAIPLTAFFVVAWRLVRKKYLPAVAG